jgi:hypothetical protein
MADFDVAAHNFMMNTMRGGGTGGSTGASAHNELSGAFSGQFLGAAGIDMKEKTAQGAPGIGGKLVEGLVLNAIQGTIQAVELSNLGIGRATGLDGVSPLGINVAQKVPSIVSQKGR